MSALPIRALSDLPAPSRVRVLPIESLQHPLSVYGLAAGERGMNLQHQRINALCEELKLPTVKTLESYDFSFASGAPKAQIQELARLSFIQRAENVVLFGPSGVGKEPSGDGPGIPSGHGRDQDALHHRSRSHDPCGRQGPRPIVQITGDSYRLKDKRKAGAVKTTKNQ